MAATILDHAVILVDDLDTAVGRYERLGFRVVAGGRHSTGTHNALIGLADGSYLELIAFLEPSPAHRWWPLLATGGGLVDVCLGSDGLEGDVARLRDRGVAMQPPRAMGRRRPDGVELEWRVAIPSPAGCCRRGSHGRRSWLSVRSNCGSARAKRRRAPRIGCEGSSPM